MWVKVKHYSNCPGESELSLIERANRPPGPSTFVMVGARGLPKPDVDEKEIQVLKACPPTPPNFC